VKDVCDHITKMLLTTQVASPWCLIYSVCVCHYRLVSWKRIALYSPWTWHRPCGSLVGEYKEPDKD
jgi:hypothetical protein